MSCPETRSRLRQGASQNDRAGKGKGWQSIHEAQFPWPGPGLRPIRLWWWLPSQRQVGAGVVVIVAACGGGGGLSGLGQTGTDFTNSLANIGTDISSGDWSSLPGDVGTLLASQTVLGIPLWGALIGGYFLWDMITSHKVQVGRR